jgi:HSP20 family molecular chaperone IbpA
VFDDVLGSLFSDSFPTMLRQSTEGYPVADIYRNDGGDTVMEFALAGFNKEELSIDIQPGKRSITVKASSSSSEGADNRRIARRSFQKTFVNYDDNLDLTNASAAFENGLLTVMVPQRPEVTPLQLEIK